MINVFKYKDVSYIKHGRLDDFLVNGKQPTKTQTPDWSVFNGDVESITVEKDKYNGISHYEVMNKNHDIISKHRVSVEEYEQLAEDDEENPILDLYLPISNPYTRVIENIEFKVWVVDREPYPLPDYITISFPNNVTELRDFAYIFSCSISGKPLFNLIWDRVEKKIKDNPNFRMLDGNCTIFSNGVDKNKGEMFVSRRIFIPKSLQKDEVTTFYRSLNARKKSTKTVRLTEKWIPAFDLSHKSKECTLRGNNYEELKQLIEEKIQHYENQIDDNVWSECECCKGIGLIYKEKA